MSVPTAASADAQCATEAGTEQLAAAMASRCGTRVEVLAGRTETSQVFAQPDGGFSMESATEPERVRSADGSWTAVDLSLHPGGDGRLVPAASVADVSFSAGGTGPLVELSSAGRQFTLSWPDALPTPTVSDASAIYPEVMPGVDLRVTATRTGFRHDLIIKTAEAAANPKVRTVSFAVGGNASLTTTDQGGLIVNSDHGVLAVAGGPMMWDASTGGAASQAKRSVSPQGVLDSPDPHAAQSPVAVSVQDHHVVLTPDSAMLEDQATVFPVVVDPAYSTPTSTKWAYANNANTNWTVPEPWAGVNPSNEGGDGHLYRSFFRLPTASGGVSILGKYIKSAKVTVKLTHTYSCSETSVRLYRTSGITATPRSTWGSMKLQKLLDTVKASANASCSQPDKQIQFDGSLLSDLRYGVSKGWSSYTVGLVTGGNGESESAQSEWKRFGNHTLVLVVDYDSYPGRPSSRSTSGVACTSGGVQIGTTTPTLKAKFTDADTTQSLTAYFEWVDATSSTDYDSLPREGKPTHSGMTNGQYGTVTLSTGVSDGGTYAWRVRAKDPYGVYGGWSDWCVFSVDTTKPIHPDVDSADYPDDGTEHGGPGVAGSFVITPNSADKDVTAVLYGWSSPTHSVATTGAAVTLSLTPPQYGENILYAQTVDKTGNTSLIETYTFTVGRPSGPVASWPLEKRPDVTAGALQDGVGEADLTATDVTWQQDARLMGAQTAAFNGSSSFATTAGPVLNTSHSYSVAAWVRITDATGYRTVMAQDGSVMSPFRLQYRESYDAWCMTTRDADSATGVLTNACGPKPVLNRWTHLVGVYDQAEAQIRLYVNGVLAASAAFTSAWTASGATTVGRALNNGAAADRFSGQIADARVYDRVVVPQDITSGTNDLLPLMQTTRVGAWGFDFADGADDSGWGRTLNPASTTTFEEDGSGGYALLLDGTSADAASDGPIVRTDQSFTVSARVRLDQDTFDTFGRTAVSQYGTSLSGFYLGFRPDGATPRWGFGVTGADAASNDATSWHTAKSATLTDDDLNTWVLLTGVYDAAAGQVLLYVDGQQVAVVSVSSTWQANGDLHVGAAQAAPNGAPITTDFWPGDIDDVQMYQGALDKDQVCVMSGSDCGDAPEQ
jgi:hypothetical protein